MWTRDSIKQMRKRYESDFSMSEQQIYKWWWDQTRKRSKKSDTKKGASEPTNEVMEQDDDLLISFQDEFGGYSSRLRLSANGPQPKVAEKDDQVDNADVDLCALLGIDVEGIALRLALGLDRDDSLPDISPVVK